MWRTIRFTFILISACAALILAVRLFDSAKRSPLEAMLSYPDGTPCERPCLLGIRPGRTTHAEAIALLSARPDYKPGEQNVAADHTFILSGDIRRGDKSNTIFVSGDHNTVSVVSCLCEDDAVTIGSVVLALGSPRWIADFNREGNTLRYFFYEEGLLAVSKGNDLQMDTPVTITIQPLDADAFNRRPWRGFSRIATFRLGP